MNKNVDYELIEIWNIPAVTYRMDDTKIINGMFHTHIFIGLRCMTCDNDGLISSCLYKRTSICKDGVEVSKREWLLIKVGNSEQLCFNEMVI